MAFVNCAKCGKAPHELSAGKFLTRVNPLGEKGVFVCSPACEDSVTPICKDGVVNAIIAATKELEKDET